MSSTSPISSYGTPATKESSPVEYAMTSPPQAISRPVQHAMEFQEGMPPQVVDADTQPRKKGFFAGRKRRIWIIGAVLAVLALVGIILGAVLGTRANKSDGGGGGSSASQDGSEDDESSSSSNPSSTESSTAEPTSTNVDNGVPEPSDVPEQLKMGVEYTSSFTFYGSNDGDASANCSSTPDIACGLYSKPGYTAGVSQNLYSSARSVGDACGTCWRLVAETDWQGSRLNNSIVVAVNDLCMADGYPVCAQETVNDFNEYNAQVNFNLCYDSGAAEELFGGDLDAGVAVGTATRVDCDEWDGQMVE